ncbi:hypothetical protein AB0876_34245 [Mycobacterium sp. NPDC049093]
MSRKRLSRNIGAVRYWHAGWSGRRPGDLLLPLARQQNRYAEIMRISVPQARRHSADPDLASGRIYDINKLYVTTKRDFAHAWSVCVPDASLRPNLKLLFGIEGTAYYEVEILDASGHPLTTPPEPDPDYPGGGSFQVEMARVLAVHRTQMGLSAAQAHMDRMATAHLNDC